MLPPLIHRSFVLLLGVASLVRLRVSHSCLSSLSDLSSLTSLNRLYLDENDLTELSSRMLPSSLRTLSASSNRLVGVDHMDRLPHLTELHLPGNRLTNLQWLNPTAPLQRLNVAGNRLCSLSCLQPLRAVASLTELNVTDAQYGPNPVCSLHNWRVLALHSLSRLCCLDGSSVSAAEVARSECVWRKKSVYYTRCRQRLKRVSIELQRWLASHCQQAVTTLDGLRRTAWQMQCAMDELQCVVDEQQHEGLSVERRLADGALAALSGSLADCASRVRSSVVACNVEVGRLVAWYRSMKSSVALRQRSMLRAMDVEMDTGGNVRWDESEQLMQCAARAIQSTTTNGLTLQLIRAVQLRDTEYRLQVGTNQQDVQQPHINATTQLDAQPAQDDEEADTPLWFTHTSPVDTQLSQPISTNSANPTSPTVMYQSALAALSAVASAPSIGRTHSLLVCTVHHPRHKERLSRGEPSELEERSESKEELQPPMSASPQVITVTELDRVVPQWHLSLRVSVSAGSVSAAASGDVCLSLLSSLPAAVLRLTSEFVGLRECALDVCAAVSSCDHAMDEQQLSLCEGASALLAQLPLSLSARCSTLHSINDTSAATAHSYTRSESAIDLTDCGWASRLSACARELSDIHQVGVVRWSQLTTLVLSCNALTYLHLPAHMPLLEAMDVSHNQLTLESFSASLFSLMPALRRLSARHNRLDWSNRRRTLHELLHCLTPCPQLQHIDWGAAYIAMSAVPEIECAERDGEPSALVELDYPYSAYVQRAVELFPALRSIDGQNVVSCVDGSSALQVRDNDEFERRLSFASCDCLQLTPTLLTDELMQRYSRTTQTAASAACSALRTANSGNTSGEWSSDVIALELDHLALTALTALSDGPNAFPHLPLTRFIHLQSLSLNGNQLRCLERLTATPLPSLIHLSIEHNQLTRLQQLEQFPALTRLDASGNCIGDLTDARLHHLTALSVVHLNNNKLRSLNGLQRCTALTELHIQHNELADDGEWQRLTECQQLRLVDARNNPLQRSTAHRLFAVYCLPNVHTLDQRSVSEDEREAALDRHCGRLTCEALLTAAGEQRMSFIEELTLAHCRLRHVDEITHAALPNLRTLCLDHNSIASTHSLQPHAHLTALHCSSNRLSELASLQTALACRQRSLMALPDSATLRQHSAVDNWLSVAYPRLHTLVLDHNHIQSMQALHLNGLTALRMLSAAGNHIARLDITLATVLPRIQQLILVDNVISKVEPTALSNCSHLTTLQLDGNHISSMPASAGPLAALTALHLSDNRCSDVRELDGIAHRIMPALSRLSLHGCPLARRHSYRPHIIQNTLPSALLTLDGQSVTADEMDAALQLHIASQHVAAVSGVQQPQTNESGAEGAGEMSLAAGRQQLGSREKQSSPTAPWSLAHNSTAAVSSTELSSVSLRSALPALDHHRSRNTTRLPAYGLPPHHATSLQLR